MRTIPKRSKLLYGILGGILWTTAAQATLEDTLQVLPASPAMTLSLDLTPKAWMPLSQRKPFSEWQQLEWWKQMVAAAKNKGIDLDKELLPLLGSHMTIAVYPQKDERPHLQAALHVKDPEKVAVLFNKGLGGKGTSWEMKTGVPFPLQVSLMGQTLVMGMAKPAAVSLDKSLLKDPLFQPTYQRYRQEPLWSYISVAHGQKLLEKFMGKETSSTVRQNILGGLGELDDSYGFALSISPQGVLFKSSTQFKEPQKQTSEQKQLVKRLQQSSGKKLDEILTLLPKQPVLLIADADAHLWGSVFQQHATDDADLRTLLKSVAAEIQKLTHLNWEKDIAPALDGRIALAVNYPANADLAKNPLPHMVLYLGVKEPERFRDMMLNQFSLNNEALAEYDLVNNFVGASMRAQSSSVKANMHSLQMMVETYGVDWGGTYPPNVAVLHKEASKSEYQYWKELTNPVNKNQGIGKKKALLDYSQYKWYKAHPDFDGMVFYEPADKTFTSYRVYGYLNGKEYQIDSTIGDMTERERPEAPKRAPEAPLKFGSKPSETHQNTPLYQLQLPSGAAQSDNPVAISPAFAIKGDVVMIAVQSQAIKHALDDHHNKAGLMKDPQFLEARKTFKQDNGLIYLDLQRISNLFMPIFTAEMPSEHADTKPIKALLTAFRYLALDGKYTAQGTENQMMLNMDWQQVDFEWIAKIPEQFIGAQERAKVSSVKANMHTLQTMVETYGVDWGGEYPANLTELHKDSSAPGKDYWRDFANPFTEGRGIGIDKSVADYKQYRPGANMAGMTWYEPIKDKSSSAITVYKIYGTDGKGELIRNRPMGSQGSIKANMHTLQTMVETYAVDWGGVYPANMTELYQEATEPGKQYWKSVYNPFGSAPAPKNTASAPFVLTNAEDADPNYKPERGTALVDFAGYRKGPEFAGKAFYVPHKVPKQPLTKYWIYGCDQNGDLITDKGGKTLFFLTNS